MHPTRVSGSVMPLPDQPLHVLLELQKRGSMEDLGLSRRGDVNPWELPQHPRAPLGKNTR